MIRAEFVRRARPVAWFAFAVLLAACQATPSKPPAPTPPAATPAPAPATASSTKSEPASGSTSTAQPVPGSSPSKADPQGGTPANPQTSEERRVAVAKQLDDSLGTFDATLHKEQTELAKEREQRAADTAKSGSGPDANGVEDVKADAGVDPGKEADRKERRGGMKSEAESGKGAKGDKNASGDNGAAERGDVGEGQVDDIVGRQICEAAQRETDPELKDKLMKECERYRKGGG
jgi:hypothetical protein